MNPSHRLYVEPLEDRTVPVTWGNPWPDATHLTLSFAPDGTAVGDRTSELFRTLDAYRIFDTIFIMTAGAENTESVSFLAYRQTISRTALGLGSAVSVLLFLTVVLIAGLFIRGFKVDLSRVRGD